MLCAGRDAPNRCVYLKAFNTISYNNSSYIMKNFKLLWLLAVAGSVMMTSCDKDNVPPPAPKVTVTFDAITLPSEGYIDNSSYTENGVTFNNAYHDMDGWVSWDGFSVSNLHDKVTPGYENQYSVYADGGANGSANFAVCYYSTIWGPENTSFFSLASGKEGNELTLMINNNTYAALSMKEGDAYAKKFEAGDWFKVTATGYKEDGTQTGTADIYLADFRDGKTYICAEWTKVDLSALGTFNKVAFTISSSDVGDYGMNTPAYFCIDNVEFSEVTTTAE